MPDDYASWRKRCPKCDAVLQHDGDSYSDLIHVVDRDKDCIVEYMCPVCLERWPRSLGEVIAVIEEPAHE